MDGKNRAASSYLSPGNPPADKEQNDPLAQVFHNACSYNFFAMAELLHRLAKGEKGKRLIRTVLIFTESSDQLSRATDRVPGLPASPGYVQ